MPVFWRELLDQSSLIMQESSLRFFTDQLQDVIKEYSNLRILKDDSGVRYLRGVLDVHDDEHNIAGQFLVEVHCSEGFPNRFPAFFEVGGEIPNGADWHKYENDQCCITVLPDEIVKCKSGISISSFIESHAIPYLANQIYRKLKGNYKNGEYAHKVSDAMHQFYSELMKTGNKDHWKEYVDIAFGKRRAKQNRNDPCLCGSGLKYKKCHLKVFDTLRDIGEREVYSFLNLL